MSEPQHDPASAALCPWQESVFFYWLGTLSADESESFVQHLGSGCRACASELADVQAVVAQLDVELARETPASGVASAELRAKLAERVEREPHPARPPAAHSADADAGRVWRKWTEAP